MHFLFQDYLEGMIVNSLKLSKSLASCQSRFSGQDLYPYQSINLALKTMKFHAKGTYYLLRYLFGEESLILFALYYSYFRYLDDTIDHPGRVKEANIVLLDRQRLLISDLYSNDPPEPNTCALFPEKALALLVAWDKDNGEKLRVFVNEMFEALYFDAQRRYKVSSSKELLLYSKRLGNSYAGLILTLSSTGSPPHTINATALYAGLGAHLAHILRDFDEDLALGYYNISGESIEELGCSLDDLKNADLRPWVRRTTAQAYFAFEKGLTALAEQQSWRCRFVYSVISEKYLEVLDTLSRHDYQIKCIQKTSRRNRLGVAIRATLMTMRTEYVSRRMAGVVKSDPGLAELS